MRHVFKYLSFLGLAMTVVPAFLVFAGQLDLAAHQVWMLAGTGLWFVTAPLWIRKKG
jgi:hypothetical protein